MNIVVLFKKKRTILIFVILICCILMMITSSFGSNVSREMLDGDGDVETQEKFDAFVTSSGVGLTEWDNTDGANGTSACISNSVSRTTDQSPGNTFLIDHYFIAPSNIESCNISFNYTVSSTRDFYPLSPTTIDVKILSSSDELVWEKNAYTNIQASQAWTSYIVDSVNGNLGYDASLHTALTTLVSGQTYKLRIEIYMKPNNNRTGTTKIDELEMNMSWTDTEGPQINTDTISPQAEMYCQGSAPLKVTATDPATPKSVTWEYAAYQGEGATYNPGDYTIINGGLEPSVEQTGTSYSTYTFGKNWNTTTDPVVTDGLYHIKITAKDSLGNTSTEEVEYYKVDNHGPSLSLESPANNNVVNGYNQVLSINAQDWSNISEVWWEYKDIGPDGIEDTGDDEWVLIGKDVEPDSGTDTNGVYSTVWHTTNVRDGSYTVRVRAWDKSPAKVESDAYILTYKVDNLKPRIENITPKERSYISGNAKVLSATVKADYEGNGIQSVAWYCYNEILHDWEEIDIDTTATVDEYSVVWDTTKVSDGTHDMKIVAINVLGTTNEALFKYTVDNSAPVLVSASASSRNLVTLLFTEANIESDSSTNTANFNIYETDTPANILTISNIEAKADGSGLKLTTGNQTEGVSYTVEIIGTIYDNAGNQLSGPTTVTFIGNGQSKGNPHGDYLNNTGWCGVCHTTHAGQASKLMSRAKEKLVCYICHDDSGLSYYDVKKEFGAIDVEGAATSHHPVPEDTQMCVTCHDPHADFGSENPMLLKVTDGNETTPHTYKSGNDVCWACHGNQATHGSTVAPILGDPLLDDKETYYTNEIGLDGGPRGVHANRDPIEFPTLVPPTYADINCNTCHLPHGSENPKLLRLEVNENVVYGNSDEFCLGCHTDTTSEGTSFLGKAVWQDTTYSAHSRTDSGALWPGGGYGVDRTTDVENRGKCINCHNVHGTEYGCGLVERFTIPEHNDIDAYANYAICFKCHGPDGVSKGVTTKDMTSYYTETYTGADNYLESKNYGGTMGHFILSSSAGFKDDSGNPLVKGWKIPCTDCHNTHGSTGENRFLLRGDLDPETNLDNLEHLFKGTDESGRAFCIQCHRTSESVQGTPYRNGNIPVLPDTNPEHASTGTIECNYCHGGGDLIKGAHAPNSGQSEGGLDCDLCHTTLSNNMGTGSSSMSRHQMTHFDADQPSDKYDASSLGVLQSQTCLSTCHTDHDVFNNDPEGSKNYLRAQGGDVAGTPAGITKNYELGYDSHLDTNDFPKVNSLCMSSTCHGTDGSLDDKNYNSSSGVSATSNLYDHLTTSSTTMSRHAISGPPTNTHVNETTLTPEFWTIWSNRSPIDANRRLICTDCHIDETTGSNFDEKQQGPHSSDNNLYMLKKPPTGEGDIKVYDSLCNYCHNKDVYGGNGFPGVTGTDTTPGAEDSNAFKTHTTANHFNTTSNPSGCLACHCGNRDFGSLGNRGSVHGTAEAKRFLNGNYISAIDIDSRDCTMNTQDPTGARCNNFKHSPTYYDY